MNYDLSVVIPIYNNDKYIERCVKSILNNKCKVEIIVVDDGSNDDTKNKLCGLSEYIKVISLKDNMGVSVARNVGLKMVSAPYFTFVDSDDYVEPNMYDFLLEQAMMNDVDIVGCNYCEFSNKKIRSKYRHDNRLLFSDDILKKVLCDQISLVVWDKIYKTIVYKYVSFSEGLKINEDCLYTISCLSKAGKAIFFNKYLYNYCKNDGSITSGYTCEQVKCNDYLKCIDGDILDKLKGYSEYDFYISCDCLKQVHLYSKCVDKENRYKYLSENISDKVLKRLLKYKINGLVKVEIVVYLISIKLHLFLFPIYAYVRGKVRRTV